MRHSTSPETIIAHFGGLVKSTFFYITFFLDFCPYSVNILLILAKLCKKVKKSHFSLQLKNLSCLLTILWI